MEASPSITAAVAALLADVAEVEALGRLVDARRIALAAEVETRSGPADGERGLAFRHGARDAENLIADVARISTLDAKRRIGLGASLAPRLTLSGDLLPGRYPDVAEAVMAGDVGVESARLLVDTLRPLRRRVQPPEAVDAAERELTEQARVLCPELLREQTGAWTARLDPDGVKPKEEEAHLGRAFRLTRTRTDGMTGFAGMLPPEQAALVRQVLADHRKNLVTIRSAAGDPDSDCLESQWVEADDPKRTKSQWDFDSFFATFAAGVRAEQDGAVGSLRSPHEVIAHVSLSALQARRGSARVDGLPTPLPVSTVERWACTGTIRLLTMDDDGVPLRLGHATRIFSPAQKKALAAVWGGCAIPGCSAPPTWCDAHHVAWWHRDDGPTDIDNGVLLCSHHHHVVHAENPAFRLVLHDGRPHLVRRGWRGPPVPEQRLRPRSSIEDPGGSTGPDVLNVGEFTDPQNLRPLRDSA